MNKSKKTFLYYVWGTVCIGMVAVWAFILNIEPFLSVNQPVGGEVLVVEGWLPDYALEKIAAEYMQNNYKTVIVCGGPLDQGMFLSRYGSYANLGRETLMQITKEKNIIAIPSQRTRRDRTYASAVAVRAWFVKNRYDYHKIDVASLGVHARRSRKLFEKAFGSKGSIGVISIENQDYDAKKWWTTSQGAKAIIMEAIAYIYTALFFHNAVGPSGRTG